eukprot:5672774-Pyramimonas_sp.AAC.1
MSASSSEAICDPVSGRAAGMAFGGGLGGRGCLSSLSGCTGDVAGSAAGGAAAGLAAGCGTSAGSPKAMRSKAFSV